MGSVGRRGGGGKGREKEEMGGERGNEEREGTGNGEREGRGIGEREGGREWKGKGEGEGEGGKGGSLERGYYLSTPR